MIPDYPASKYSSAPPPEPEPRFKPKIVQVMASASGASLYLEGRKGLRYLLRENMGYSISLTVAPDADTVLTISPPPLMVNLDGDTGPRNRHERRLAAAEARRRR